MPNFCTPMTLAGMSKRSIDLPMIFQSFGSLSFTSFGGSRLPAASATWPNVSLRPLGVCVMVPSAATHSEAGTLQRSAAAAMSISRALAPALRRYSCERRIVWAPEVCMLPQTFLRRTMFSFGETYSMRTCFQSHSSSSATIIGAAVELPCPISERA